MKIVYLAPHLSTGGCPQFILKRIQSLLTQRSKLKYEDYSAGVINIYKKVKL